MSNGEGTREATGEIASLDSFGASNTMRARQSDVNDASPLKSQYSSCGESELDRYRSTNSVMGTPSTCSTLTVYNDFTEYESGSMKKFGIGDDDGLENFSLGGRAEMKNKDQRLLTSGVSYSMSDFRAGFGNEKIQNQQNLKYGSSGLRFYDDDDDGELTMTMLDASGSMGFSQLNNDLDQGFVQKDVEGSVACKEPNALRGAGDNTETLSTDVSDHAGTTERYLLGNVDGKCSQSAPTFVEGDLSCAAGEEDKFSVFDTQSYMQIGEREIEGEDNETSSNCQHSEGEDSMYNSGADDDDKHVFHLPRSINYYQESKAENENPLLINTSVAFGSQDLDDFLLQNEDNGQVSQMLDVFHNQKEKNPEVEENQINFGSVSSMGFSSAGQKNEGQDIRDMAIVSENLEEIEDLGGTEEIKDVRDIRAAACQVQGADKLTSVTESSTDAPVDFQNIVKPRQEDVKEIYADQDQVQGAERLVNYQASIAKAIEVDLDPLAGEASQQMVSNATDTETVEKVNQYVNTEEVIDAQHADNQELDNSKIKFDKFFDGKFCQNSSNSTKHLESINAKSFENLQQVVPSMNCGMSKTLESSPTSTNLLEKNPVVPKMENFELNELYDEVVHEMEEILLDSIDSPGARCTQSNRFPELQFFTPSRDGGLTASTSDTYDAYLLVHRPMRFDRIEVVGARQKKGDVSFSERLVGVREYTVYKIKVWSGKNQWEVERRYRDFLTLYRRVKTLFIEQGWELPLPWPSVEKESTNIFGSASPDVIVQRSVLIQECLQSIIHTRFFSSPPSALIWFLSPQDLDPTSSVPNALVSQSLITGGTSNRNFSTLGKTISLVVEVPPYKSTKQMLEAQHNTCAGCYKHFDDGKTLIQDFVQTFGWGNPRLCEYTGQLFCSSCHTNETAVLPARVLHHWDFNRYPVSQLAKSYLDSIQDQPMLCVTAVNPFLLSKVPALLHVISVRKKIGAMLPYVRCPFQRSINIGLGTRRYLLESNDFFALRDLIDLSKGAFAALPVMVETVARKILEHITDQCLICCDVGVPCSARQDCSDPVSLIFPFQEDEIRRCKTCQSVFHEPCFRKLTDCPCGARLKLDEKTSLTNRDSQVGSGVARGTSNFLGRGLGSGLPSGFLSGLFTKDNPEKTREHKDENIIIMDSLPSTSL